jgi:hypothetical protein
MDVNSFVWQQDQASKDTFFIIYLTVQGNLGLKISDQKMKYVTQGGGGRKSAKKVSRIIWMAP